MRRLENVLAGFLSAESEVQLAEALVNAAHAEGYENVVLSCIDRGGLTAVPWLSLPSGFAETYVAENWGADDPVLRRAMVARVPFSWRDVLSDGQLSDSQRRMMAAAGARGVHGGITIPLHGAGARCHIVSLSLRRRRDKPDPKRQRIVAVMALQALSRYMELTPQTAPGRVPRTPQGRLRRLAGSLRLDELLQREGASPFVLPPEHLYGLVLIEVAAHRWSMGLTGLGGRIYRRRNTGVYADLERWGLVVDVPDDQRWRYYLAPSVLGRVHLRASPDAPGLRRRVRAEEIDRREVSDGIVPE